jgi:ankyrin repeat protein
VGVQVDLANDGGATPLHFAAGSGQTAAMAYLLERGASLHARTLTGATVSSVTRRPTPTRPMPFPNAFSVGR